MQEAYQETWLDRGLAIVAELMFVPFFWGWFAFIYDLINIVPLEHHMEEIAVKEHPFYSLSVALVAWLLILSACELICILWRATMPLLILSLILAIPPFVGWSGALMQDWNIGDYIANAIFAGSFLQVLALTILLSRRLRFAWLQQRKR